MIGICNSALEIGSHGQVAYSTLYDTCAYRFDRTWYARNIYGVGILYHGSH